MERNQVRIFEKWKVLSNESLEIILGKLENRLELKKLDGIHPPSPGNHIFFSGIRAKAFVSQNMEPIANKALMLFVRHSILVRPLGDGGKMKLIQDYSTIEEALSPLCSRLIDLGESYR